MTSPDGETALEAAEGATQDVAASDPTAVEEEARITEPTEPAVEGRSKKRPPLRFVVKMRS